MVHIPVLKIDVPEPRVQELLPALVEGLISALHKLIGAAEGLLHPRTAEQEAARAAAWVARLPPEFQKARHGAACR